MNRDELTLGNAKVVGLDGCSTGWIGAVLTSNGITVDYLSDLAEVDELCGPHATVGIDMPLVLAASGKRPADEAAKRILGRRSSTIFLAPVKSALNAVTFEEANAANRIDGGFGLSRQSYGLLAKIREVQAWSAATSLSLYEIHPEIGFMDILASEALPSKKTWAGVEMRRRALEQVGFLPIHVSTAAGRNAAPDDVLDACVVAWVANEVANNSGRALPTTYRKDSNGRAEAIWRVLPN